MNRDEIKSWLRLSSGFGVGPSLFVLLCEEFGSPEAVFQAGRVDFTNRGFSGSVYELVQNIPIYSSDLLLKLLDEGVQFIPYVSDVYPFRLKQIHSFPPFIFLRGSTKALNEEKSIGIVGSRQATNYGLEEAYRFGKALADQGFVIISGFALGVDIAAHRGCFESNGPTLAVMAHGLDYLAPQSHRKYVSSVLDNGGGFISEFLPGTHPHPILFPRRNRIISGLSKGVLVIQCKIKSGALITARCALEQNRDVFALPGRITDEMSAGPHSLIKLGAKLITDVDDILDEWSYKKQLSLALESENVDPIVRRIQNGETTVDQLVAGSGVSAQKIMLRLAELELDGKVILLSGGVYKAI